MTARSIVEQGILKLDTPVVKYLPQGYLHRSNPFETKPSLEDDLVNDPRFQAITVRMILNHTSGLPNWAQGPLNFESVPGTEWLYSGEGYVLLQRAVEAVTGEQLDQFMATQVFKPLGMSHSDYVWNQRLDRNLVPAMTSDGKAIKPWHFKTPIAAATLYTSVEDYAKFVANVVNNDYLLKQLTKSPVTVEPRLNLSWGLGLGYRT
jgi:CubicO group peptidase (beta-lactamase class C family)